MEKDISIEVFKIYVAASIYGPNSGLLMDRTLEYVLGRHTIFACKLLPNDYSDASLFVSATGSSVMGGNRICHTELSTTASTVFNKVV